eukprot:scaffold945_cov103-Skeletonema_dohrnii-CCMP3373.AAC.2
MFQRNYTPKTDVWSAGATLYVLVAGYPAERLQETFNVLQNTKKDRLRQLPNMPDNMPDSFYDMLEGALSYKHKIRSTAGQLMSGEFAQFHIQHEDNTTEAVSGGTSGAQEQPATPSRTKSVLLEGSVGRHSAYLGYQKFERSVTTVLATMLTKEHARRLVTLLEEESKKESSTKGGNSFGEAPEGPVEADLKSNKEKLQVVTISSLLGVLEILRAGSLLKDDIDDVLKMIRSLKDFVWYESFAYHISSLRQFVIVPQGSTVGGSKLRNALPHASLHGGNRWNGASSMRAKKLNDGTAHTAALNMSMR